MVIEVRMLALCSQLGPPDVDCIYCRQPVAVGRSEWSDQSWKGRSWYVIITMIYAALVGSLTGWVVHQSIARWNKNPTNLDLRSWAFPVTAGIAGSLVILLQVYRIYASRRRSLTGYRLTQADFFFDLQWNLHLKYLFLLIWIGAIAMIKFQ